MGGRFGSFDAGCAFSCGQMLSRQRVLGSRDSALPRVGWSVSCETPGCRVVCWWASFSFVSVPSQSKRGTITSLIGKLSFR